MDTLSRRQTVTELVAVYESVAADIRSGFAALHAAEVKLNAAFVLGGSGYLYIGDNRGRYPDFKNPDLALTRLKRDTWRFIVERLELRRLLSVKRANELDKILSDGALPDITVDNVMAFAASYLANLDIMLTEAVAEVFEVLRPHQSKLKTNSEMEIPRKVVLEYTVTRGYGSPFRVSDHAEKLTTAIENVFSALDGKGQVTRQYHSDMSNAVKAMDATGRGETPYFRLRACKNRNLHIEFKRLDLLAKLNQIAGGKRLRPADPVPL
jgi:hypothetical protein